jgi:hypothetical protein
MLYGSRSALQAGVGGAGKAGADTGQIGFFAFAMTSRASLL